MSKKTKQFEPDTDSKIGAVMVVGGGIGGIQASLDLAESGYKVYLVEASPSIGGTMAQLDKTFPTNDCSMCILSPKLVECGRHLNIELITLGQIKSLKGRAGNFKARILRKARYLDPDKCTGCGACLENCPTRYLPQYEPDPFGVPLKQEEQKLADRLIDRYGTSHTALLRILQDVNEKLRFLSKGIIHYLSEKFSVPVSAIYRIGTFYTSFSLTPRGKYIINVCLGTACHIKGASKLINEFMRELNIDVGSTTKDMLFTLETVRCLGCCSLAPVARVGDRIYGSVKVSDIHKILKDYRK